jgi:hypothetical protein
LHAAAGEEEEIWNQFEENELHELENHLMAFESDDFSEIAM